MTDRYEPHCDCLGGHVSMVPDPNGRWCRADEVWQDISTAPHEELLVLGWYEGGTWKQEIALASAGERFANGYSNRWFHGRATHWMPLHPAPSPTEADHA